MCKTSTASGYERQTVPEKKKVACDTYEWMRQNNNNVGGGVLFC